MTETGATDANLTVGSRTRAIEAGLLGLVWFAVAWFYVWTVRSDGIAWDFGAEQTDYYNLLVHGFLDGHLSLKADVPDELLQLKDPYDPAQRPPGIALHDVSLYQGRYYIYFGVVPAVILLLPFRLLTGMDLPLPAAVLIFTLGGFGASAAVWGQLRRRYFPNAGIGLSLLCVLALGFASLGPLLLRRHSVYELPISCAYCCAMLALGSMYWCLHGGRRQLAWMAATALLLGLAIGARPTYLFSGAIVIIPLLAHWRRSRAVSADATGPGEARWHVAGYAFAPLLLIGGGLALYNYLRFGNPLEFGISYQLSGIYESRAKHFSLTYTPVNSYLYLLAPSTWGRYFPFVHGIRSPALPSGYFGFDQVFGALVNLPLTGFAVVALWPWRRDEGHANRPLRLWLGAVAALCVTVGGMLLLFYAAMGRYICDFVPALILCACVGVLRWEQLLQRAQSAWKRRAGWGLAAGALIFSVSFALLLSVGAYGNLRRLDPVRYAQIARIADAPVHFVERWTGAEHGALALDLRFPRAPVGSEENLVVTGGWDETDRVFVRYGDARQVLIGFEHAGGSTQLSRAFVADDAVHHVRLALGSLFLPEDRLIAMGRPRGEILRLTRRLEIVLDGETVFAQYQRFHDAAPSEVRVGARAGFTGEISRVARVADYTPSVVPDEASSISGYGAVRLKVRLPASHSGQREPLVVTGESGRGDFCYIEYGEAQTVRFGLDHWGRPGLRSPPLTIDYAVPHSLEIAMGSLPLHAVPVAGESGWRNEIVVTLDDRIVWRSPARFYAVEPGDVFFGRNPIGGSSCGPSFTGTLSSVEPVMPAGR